LLSKRFLSDVVHFARQEDEALDEMYADRNEDEDDGAMPMIGGYG